MTNQLLDAGFLDDQSLSGPLPDQWLLLPTVALTKRRCSWLLTLIVVVSGLMVVQWWWSSDELFPPFLLVWVLTGLIFLASWLCLPLQIRHSRFLLRTQDFLLQSGVFWRRAVLIPLHRVQHVTISQGPLQKRFGLATLKVYTAGGLDAEAALADIEYPVAKALSEQLSRLIPRGDIDAQ
ncbi:MAG: PH domain-containing protein [Pararheinheimera sp.]|nr:PH domain-containing protein [Rheinheimera sp.]